LLFALDTNNGLVAYRITPRTPDDESLTATRQGNQVRLSWLNMGAILESTRALGTTATWTAIVGTETTTEHLTDPAGNARFFRLRR